MIVPSIPSSAPFYEKEHRVNTRNENSAPVRGAILAEAESIINGARQDMYGNPEDCFTDIAELWSWWLQKKADNVQKAVGQTVAAPALCAHDVAMLMCLLKIARESNGAGRRDNILDACGYLGLYADLREGS